MICDWEINLLISCNLRYYCFHIAPFLKVLFFYRTILETVVLRSYSFEKLLFWYTVYITLYLSSVNGGMCVFPFWYTVSVNTKPWTNVVLMLVHRLRRWPNIKTTLILGLLYTLVILCVKYSRCKTLSWRLRLGSVSTHCNTSPKTQERLW